MSTRERIEERLRQEFRPAHLEIADESDKHAGHPGAAGGGGHYQVTIVSSSFEGKTLLEQHRMVNTALKEMMGAEIHALALKTVPQSEWES